MRVIALSTLRDFWERGTAYADARDPILAWYRQALRADWRSPADVKREFGNASILRDGRVVSNIAGNKYRLVVWTTTRIALSTFASLARMRSTVGSTLKRFKELDNGYQAHSNQG